MTKSKLKRLVRRKMETLIEKLSSEDTFKSRNMINITQRKLGRLDSFEKEELESLYKKYSEMPILKPQ